MYSLNHVLLVMAAVLCFASAVTRAQTPTYSKVGRTPSGEEIRAWDIAVGPDGKELPPGRGTAKEGALLYGKLCAACHGQNLEGSPLGTALVGGKGTLATTRPVKSIGSYWAFATTVWDYINRSMPRNQEGSLQPDEVYALTAFVLYRNEIIQESDVMDARSLPKIQMPNRNGFVPPRLEDIPDARKRGCRLGHCP